MRVAVGFAVELDELVGAQGAQAAADGRHRVGDSDGSDVQTDVTFGAHVEQRRQPAGLDGDAGQPAQNHAARVQVADERVGALARPRGWDEAVSIEKCAGSHGVAESRGKPVVAQQATADIGRGERVEDQARCAIGVVRAACGGDEENGALERRATLEHAPSVGGAGLLQRVAQRQRMRSYAGRVVVFSPAAHLHDDLQRDVEGAAESGERCHGDAAARRVERGDVHVSGLDHGGDASIAAVDVCTVDANGVEHGRRQAGEHQPTLRAR